MSIPIGRKGQIFLKKEAAFGTAEALTATEALRHIEVGFGFDPFNRVTSPEKKQTPGPVTRFDRKKTAELGSLVALLRPSAALNTLPEVDPILEAAFGSVVSVTLATTVEASPSPTATGATVASAGALAVGDAVAIEVTGQTDPIGPFIRILTAVATNALTWSPALPAAPATGDDVKGGITYKLTTDLAISLTIAHYLDANRKRALLGAAIDSLTLTFDGNEEPRVAAAGPAAEQITAAVAALPAAFTKVGGNPPSGLDGQVLVDGTKYLIKSFEASITNALMIRNQELGVNKGTEVYRQGRREITMALEAFAETEATLYDKAEAGTNVTILHQTGFTEGNIVVVYAPRVEFKVAEQDDADEEVTHSFTGLALESADGQNDELTIALM